jgi:hypothetical protein
MAIVLDASRLITLSPVLEENRGAMTRFDRRLRRVEARAASGSQHQSPRWQVWIELRDGRMRGADGEIFSREEFEQRRLGADAIVVLPDNGRDDLLHMRRRRPSKIG